MTQRISIVIIICLMLTGCVNSFGSDGEVMKLTIKCGDNKNICAKTLECLSDEIRLKEKNLQDNTPARQQKSFINNQDSILNNFANDIDKIRARYEEGIDDESMCTSSFANLYKNYSEREIRRNQTAGAVIGAIAIGAAAYAICKDGGCGGGGGGGYAKQCCKVCKIGKACGDTCIQATDVCWVGQGCACNSY